MDVREITATDTLRAAETLLHLRPHHSTAEALAEQIDKQRADGYRVVASMEGDAAAAVAGFRIQENTAWGRHLYLDDLVTHPEHLRKGHADALFTWLDEEAIKQGCAQFHLDSGVAENREAAHRFYFNHGMRINSYHFARTLDR